MLKDKIVIIGLSGAGKTTLARRLASRLKMKVYHLDRFFWRPGWRRESRKKRINTLHQLVSEKQWIIEGTYLNSSDLHLIAADTIIFLDIPPLLCLWRIIKRHIKYHQLTRQDIPKLSTDRLTLLCMLKVLAFPVRGKRKLEEKLFKFPGKVIRLHSIKEVDGFLAQLEPSTDEKKIASFGNKRHLVQGRR